MSTPMGTKRAMASVQKRIDNQTQIYPPLDYSFHNAQQLEDAVVEPRAPQNGPKLVKQGDRYNSYGINLNHNTLNGPLETLPDFLRTILVNPNALSTLDLSFNVFTEIPINMLSDMTEVQKLAPLKQLKYLTLHGNPIEITVPYLRSYILALLPGLRSLNCTPVTKGDRKISEVWEGMNKPLLPNYTNKKPIE
ncbi:unnamed protein product [Adineta steineri]|uniref:Leucine-rich repeat-containing protein 51 n=1 Tax=Adineta steineri TaxID=433720 RepID=A0A818Z8J8_9BILA|nr:unnamed protein product [Adineta steineri]CAF1162352.1 unnamed protein product [Adineta steineri]CAF3537243.1 unnamed protein product [Adineta steineri]CAF3761360.1 unnamed protein product [Adineta steineri]CAF4163771.1 unnamed protein product [Adineta steineri]